MSNITCPTCGVISYDCGKAGFKTKREMELEKENKRLREGAASIARGQALVDEFGYYEAIIEHIKELEKKLDTAVKALKEVIKENESCMDCLASRPAEKALKEIKG